MLVFFVYWFSLLANANATPCSRILCTLKMEVTCSSKTLVLTGLTRCHIQEDGTH
jgi:hypothetical protein